MYQLMVSGSYLVNAVLPDIGEIIISKSYGRKTSPLQLHGNTEESNSFKNTKL